VFGAPGLTSLKMAFIENLTDEDIEHLAALSSLEVLTLNVSPHPVVCAGACQTEQYSEKLEQDALLALKWGPEPLAQVSCRHEHAHATCMRFCHADTPEALPVSAAPRPCCILCTLSDPLKQQVLMLGRVSRVVLVHACYRA
jgi:hypothetical protein